MLIMIDDKGNSRCFRSMIIIRPLKLELGESSFLLFEYSVEYLIEYSDTRQGK